MTPSFSLPFPRYGKTPYTKAALTLRGIFRYLFIVKKIQLASESALVSPDHMLMLPGLAYTL